MDCENLNELKVTKIVTLFNIASVRSYCIWQLRYFVRYIFFRIRRDPLNHLKILKWENLFFFTKCTANSFGKSVFGRTQDNVVSK